MKGNVGCDLPCDIKMFYYPIVYFIGHNFESRHIFELANAGEKYMNLYSLNAKCEIFHYYVSTKMHAPVHFICCDVYSFSNFFFF
jgi:hypothetical protein